MLVLPVPPVYYPGAHTAAHRVTKPSHHVGRSPAGSAQRRRFLLFRWAISVRRFFSHAHRDVHAEEGIAETREGAPQWQNMFRRPGDGDTNQVAAPHNTIRRIEINQASARQESLHPGVCRTAARDACIVARNKDITANET